MGRANIQQIMRQQEEEFRRLNIQPLKTFMRKSAPKKRKMKRWYECC